MYAAEGYYETAQVRGGRAVRHQDPYYCGRGVRGEVCGE